MKHPGRLEEIRSILARARTIYPDTLTNTEAKDWLKVMKALEEFDAKHGNDRRDP